MFLFLPSTSLALTLYHVANPSYLRTTFPLLCMEGVMLLHLPATPRGNMQTLASFRSSVCCTFWMRYLYIYVTLCVYEWSVAICWVVSIYVRLFIWGSVSMFTNSMWKFQPCSLGVEAMFLKYFSVSCCTWFVSVDVTMGSLLGLKCEIEIVLYVWSIWTKGVLESHSSDNLEFWFHDNICHEKP